MTTRLHITPFNPTLLDSVLPPALRPLATDISFHCLQTFPENNYGYLTLPAMEAEKVRKKLHGSILKGKKLKVEVARPDSKKRPSTAAEEESEVAKKPSKKSKHRKAEQHADGVLEGTELPADRHVKRGWTQPKSAKADKRKRERQKEKDGSKKSKQQAKSKYTDNAECLFRTKTPPNRSDIEAGSKKKDPKSNKRKSSSREVVVHEFAQTTTHPTFVRSENEGKKVTSEFVDGKGWIDSDGDVRESVSGKTIKSTHQPGKRDGVKDRMTKNMVIENESRKGTNIAPTRENPSTEESSDWTSTSGSSDDDDNDGTSSDGDETSEDGGSSSESGDTDAKSELDTPDIPEASVTPARKMKGTKGKTKNQSELSDLSSQHSSENSSDEAMSVNSEIDVSDSQNDKEVHPLEALFKRKNPSEKNRLALEVNTSFSFFGKTSDDGMELDGEEQSETSARPLEPLTPFTKRDLQFRGLRSAAPTPDTALPTRTAFWNDASDEEMEHDEDMLADSGLQAINTPSKVTSVPGSQQTKKTEDSDFAKWFWENRGENNRAWKRRRREAAKEKRQRENRRKGTKGRG